MHPPRQSLDAHGLPGSQIDDRLIVEADRIASKRGSEILLKKRACANVGVHFGIEKTAVGVESPGAIERDMSAPEHVPDVSIFGGNLCDANIGSDRMLACGDLDRPVDIFDQGKSNTGRSIRLLS